MRDLRVSVTDRCNFRCPYCMPADREFVFAERRDLLTFEEIERLVRIAMSVGAARGSPIRRVIRFVSVSITPSCRSDQRVT